MTTLVPYRSRATVDAMGPLTRYNASEIAEWCGGTWWADVGEIEFGSSNVREYAWVGDMVVLDDGEFFAFPPSLFENHYEPVEETKT